jgi:glycosyltransferase involved in cell wall biosynthesis
MSPLRVAFLNTRHPCLSHTFIEREVDALRRGGVEVHTFSVRRPGSADLLSEAHREAHRTTCYLLDAPGIAEATAWALWRRPLGLLRGLVGCQRLSPPGLRARLLHVAYLAEAVRLAREMRRRGLSHVHVHMANNGAAVALLACRVDRSLSYSLTVHGSAEFFNVEHNRLRQKTQEAVFVRCISEFCRAQVMAWTDPAVWEKFHVVHCGVETRRFGPARSGAGGVFRILSVGRMEPIKGYPVLLRACRLLSDRGVDWSLDMVGEGPMRPALARLAADLGIAGRVTFHGAVGHDRMPRRYAEADVLAVSSFMEGVPVVLMEAMASGLAVVSTAVGGVGELVRTGHSGLLVPPGSAEALAESLQALAIDPGKVAAMGAAGRGAVIEGYDSERTGAEVARLLARYAGDERSEPRPARSAGAVRVAGTAAHPPYVLVSACRDEARFARRAIESVLRQTAAPGQWVIVDDGSTDGTLAILEEYARRQGSIRVLRRPDRGARSVGPGVIEAFNAGLALVDLNRYAYLCKLDLDVELPPRYFEELLRRMEAQPRLGTCSGKPYFRGRRGRLVREDCGDEISVGMTKLYRIACFRQVGGFVPQVMWDGIDCHRCRMLGWSARSFDDPELRFVHLRPIGASDGTWMSGRRRHGSGQWFMGTAPLYMAASALRRMARPPLLLGGAAIWLGYVESALRRRPRYDDPEFRRFLRAYQRDCLLRGKDAATRRLDARQAAVWDPTREVHGGVERTGDPRGGMHVLRA